MNALVSSIFKCPKCDSWESRARQLEKELADTKKTYKLALEAMASGYRLKFVEFLQEQQKIIDALQTGLQEAKSDLREAKELRQQYAELETATAALYDLITYVPSADVKATAPTG